MIRAITPSKIVLSNCHSDVQILIWLYVRVQRLEELTFKLVFWNKLMQFTSDLVLPDRA
jgi:hypothetical protein